MNKPITKSWRRRISVLALAFLMVMSLGLSVACDTAEETPTTTYKLGDPQWDSVQFHNAVTEIILNNGYNIATEIVSASTPITWQALVDNELQIYMEVWSDNLINYEKDVTNGPLIELGVNFADNAQGVYVPRYVIEGDAERGIEAMAPDLKTVQDLEKYVDVFADPDDPGMGRLYGAPPGWEVDNIMQLKHIAYGLDETINYFSPGSDTALAASLAVAYEDGEAWAGYYWEPTWVSGKLDLVLLEDNPYTNKDDMLAGLTEFPSNRVTIVINPIVQEEHPEVADMLSRYETSSALTAAALAYMNDNDASVEEAAVWFLTENPDLLEAWIADADILEKITDALVADS